MPDLDPTKIETEGVFEFFRDFLNQIDDISYNSRDESIIAIYNKTLEKNTPWLTQKGNGNGNKNKLQSGSISTGKTQKPLHKEYIKQIEANPADKAILIKEFLEYFPDISLTDRNVLAENFKGLTYKELYTEFENLTQIFQ